MLVAVTLLCVWLGVIANRANRQRRAVETIKSHGGFALYDFQFVERNTFVDIIPPPSPAKPDWLRDLVGVDYFATVVFASIDVDRRDYDQIAALTNLPKLQSLELQGPGVVDSDLASLKEMAELNTLFLANTPVTDAGLRYLEGMTSLEYLDIYRTNVTAAGVKQLQRALPRLEVVGQ
jgi:hypothetical protein